MRKDRKYRITLICKLWKYKSLPSTATWSEWCEENPTSSTNWFFNKSNPLSVKLWSKMISIQTLHFLFLSGFIYLISKFSTVFVAVVGPMRKDIPDLRTIAKEKIVSLRNSDWPISSVFSVIPALTFWKEYTGRFRRLPGLGHCCGRWGWHMSALCQLHLPQHGPIYETLA